MNAVINSLSYLASRCTLMVIMQKHLIAQRHWLIRIKYSRGQWNTASKCLRGQKQMLHSHDGIDAPAVSLPHAPEPRLPTYIPNLCKNRTRGHYGRHRQWNIILVMHIICIKESIYLDPRQPILRQKNDLCRWDLLLLLRCLWWLSSCWSRL